MTDSNDTELAPAEAAAFATLPRVSAHDDLAEQRTVQALRDQGLLRVSVERRGRRLSATAAVAAAMLLFAGGTLFGRTLATREVRSASPATQVQRTGTAYVAALVRLSDARPDEQTPGVEAGAATLRAAAISLSQIRPNDSIAHRLRSSLSTTGSSSLASDPTVIWF